MTLSMGLAVGVKDFRATQELKSFLKHYPVDALVLFNSPFDSPDNVWSDPAAALEAVYEFSCTIGPLVRVLAVDQEGGRVRRLRAPFINLPSAEKVSQLAENHENLATIAEIYGKAARQMALTGVHLNFAPVCDLRYAESNQVVGDRSFGSEPEPVNRLVSLFCRSFRNENVWCTLKHFPGHGPSAFDSHERVAELFVTPQELESRDLNIFVENAKHAAAIMTAHIAFESDSDECFSLSKKYLPKWKKKIKDPVLWFTDDLLHMKAVSERQPWRMAYDLNYDLALLCGKLDESANAIDDLERYVESLNEAFSEREARRKRQEQLTFPTSNRLSWKQYRHEVLELEKRAQDLLESIL